MYSALTFVNSISHSTVMYSLYLRERIVRLYDSGLHGMALVRILEKEGFKVTKSGVHYVITKYQRTGIIFDFPRSGRPKVLSDASHTQIDDWLKENNELTTNNILNKLSHAGVSTSRSSVARAIHRVWWSGKATRYCQLIRQANKQKRLDFCETVINR